MRTGRLALAILSVVGMLAGAGCAAPKPTTEDGEKEAARRIDEICAMPDKERDAELERLKKEAGLVLYCGDRKKP